ncbi:MAG TPA: HEAT repeat domain-containing protein [Bacteroidota bacterium]|nr:HEAT repeat domain-containing protein [Bacteroidota bacterium]
MNTTARAVAAALALIAAPRAGNAQDVPPPAPPHFKIEQGRVQAAAYAWAMPAAREDDKSDAGYALYREGYALILEEKYPEARKKFGELLAKYPGSSYADEARYWTAFSLRNSDREKAIEDYKKFIRDHPKSSYYDDAVADLNALRVEMPAVAPVAVHPPGIPRQPFPPMAPNMENLLRQANRTMRRAARAGDVHAMGLPFGRWHEEEKLDDDTRLKMDALYALGESKEDDRSFAALKDVALDVRQVRPLREAAMDALSGFTKHDALTVFVEIAQKDTNADIQGAAIDYIGEHGSDKNQRVTILEDLFRTLPKTRSEQRKTIVYTIADVGNDRAVEFLKKVALNDEDYSLRRDAVYYLGSIGGENARSALYEILKGH